MISLSCNTFSIRNIRYILCEIPFFKKKVFQLHSNSKPKQFLNIYNFIMIIYNNKGNPYGLKVEICVRAAGSNLKIHEFTSDGTYIIKYFKSKNYMFNWKNCRINGVLCLNVKLILFFFIFDVVHNLKKHTNILFIF